VAEGAEHDDARKIALKRLKAKRSFRGMLLTALGVSVLMAVIWLLSGGGYFWPIWVMFGLGVALVTTGWSAYGPTSRPITEDEIRAEAEKIR
jgi:uncharacterized membrane protein